MEIDDTNTFYFVAFINNKTALTVIDLDQNVSYQRSDWDVVNDENFNNPNEAIDYALGYEIFESRYDKSLNEKIVLTLDD
jgi:LPS O-antigen subunit length determinant protein (WzzB/FepE family)